MSEEPIRVLLAKVGLDGHDRGVKVVARALRDAGMEVVYTGLHRSPEEVVATAAQEDVDVIGVSLLSGAHMALFPRIIDLMKEQEIFGDHLLLGGGVIPDEDVEELKRMGVDEIMGQDTPPDAIVDLVRDHGRRTGCALNAHGVLELPAELRRGLPAAAGPAATGSPSARRWTRASATPASSSASARSAPTRSSARPSTARGGATSTRAPTWDPSRTSSACP